MIMRITLARRASSKPFKSDSGKNDKGFTRRPVNPYLRFVFVYLFVLCVKIHVICQSPGYSIMIGKEISFIFLSTPRTHLPPHLVHVCVVAVLVKTEPGVNHLLDTVCLNIVLVVRE